MEMSNQQEDFKWFGEGFEGFPKRLPEDTVEYTIFIIDAKLADAQIRSRLNLVLQAASELTKRSLKDYIWQRDDFKLNLKREENFWLLRGRTNYGDSVADEWLVVYLLRELSNKFPDAWIRVYDSDGEFLLIEAANTLPKWLNPEIAENRVWINKGQLRIISLEKGNTTSRNLSIKQALATISSNPSRLIHSPLIEEEAFYRIRNYPSAISDTLHHSVTTIPRRLAHILHQSPSYISPAIEAFYLRDPISLRPLQQPSPSGLTFPPEDFITTSVLFNNVGFAQLKSQEFPVPLAWKDHMPRTSSAEDIARAEIGMKLTCGFEMLVSDPQNQDKKAVREIKLLLEDIDSGEDALPTDNEVESWSKQDDDEAWLDINFEDFERELAGKGSKNPADSSGFGDKAAQENLRKMVERFEKFMNDEDAGAEGAELDEMDFDDEEDDSGSENEDKDVSFDEKEFTRMMREMMGMPVDLDTSLQPNSTQVEKIQELDSNASDADEDEGKDEDEDEEIRKLSERMEAELNETGALNLDPTPQRIQTTKSGGKGKEKAIEGTKEEDSEDESEEVNIDFNLAKNMLEAFKGQSGMAGPAGNMMGLMGVQLPRDERDDETK